MKDLGDMLRESGINMVLFGALMILTGLAGLEIAWYFAIGTTIAIAAYVGFLMIFLWAEPTYEGPLMWTTGEFSVSEYAKGDGHPIEVDETADVVPISSPHDLTWPEEEP